MENFDIYDNIPTAPTKEDIDRRRRDNIDMQKISPNFVVQYRCPYCGHLMYAPYISYSDLPILVKCVKCGYEFSEGGEIPYMKWC